MSVTIRGIDVSYAQPGFDWALAARQGAQFGWANRSEGTGVVDRQFDTHWAAIKAQGLPRGAYQFSRWDLGTAPADEARWFLMHLPPLEDQDFLVLDIENSPAGVPGRELSPWALAWLAVVEHETQRKPFVYSGAYFASQFLLDPRLATYGLIAAAYGPVCPQRVGPWAAPAMWQHTASAPYAGMNVDESIFFGSADQLRMYGKAPQAPAPAPVPQPATAPQAPAPGAVQRFMLLVDERLRPVPVLAAPRYGPTLPAGTIVAAVTPPRPLPAQTPHWLFTRTGGDVRGYLLRANLTAVTV